jgi:hypothetical protein
LRYAAAGEIGGYLEAIGSDSRRSMRPPEPESPHGPEAEFSLPQGPALPLFMFTQVGYLALYGAALVKSAEVERILTADFLVPNLYALVIPAILAMCGIAIRIYLISAVGWRHPLAGRKFTMLFPFLLIFDAIWAASPLLIWHEPKNYGLGFAGVALLAYVPFAQRTLIHALYPSRRH